MKIEYSHGQRLTKLPHERSPLEAAIDRYVEKAKAYYREEEATKTFTQVERDKKLSEALRH